jgi:fido (protein-threonine AMPylation protein)
MLQVFDDARHWHDNAVYDPTEIAVRLHHRLVAVHPYPNGNGRQTRFLADLYLHLAHQSRLTWGATRLEMAGEQRTAYLTALRAADGHDCAPLIAFAQS